MFTKLGNSQSTYAGGVSKLSISAIYSPKGGASAIRNPFKEVLPVKFPKNKIRKPTEKHILEETTYSCFESGKTLNGRPSATTRRRTGATCTKSW